MLAYYRDVDIRKNQNPGTRVVKTRIEKPRVLEYFTAKYPKPDVQVTEIRYQDFRKFGYAKPGYPKSEWFRVLNYRISGFVCPNTKPGYPKLYRNPVTRKQKSGYPKPGHPKNEIQVLAKTETCFCHNFFSGTRVSLSQKKKKIHIPSIYQYTIPLPATYLSHLTFQLLKMIPHTLIIIIVYIYSRVYTLRNINKFESCTGAS